MSKHPAVPSRGLGKDVYDYLVTEPRFRERRNKDRGIVNLIIKKYPPLADAPREHLIVAMQDYASMDRAWRQILSRETNAHLRGKDYEDKEELETEAQRELGYNV